MARDGASRVSTQNIVQRTVKPDLQNGPLTAALKNCAAQNQVQLSTFSASRQISQDFNTARPAIRLSCYFEYDLRIWRGLCVCLNVLLLSWYWRDSLLLLPLPSRSSQH